MRNSNERQVSKRVAALFRSLGQPNRVRILLAIGRGEACVCHLEAVLGERQAYISQQLMALREIGLVTARRDGKYVFYRLESPDLLRLLEKAADLCGIDSAGFVAPAPKADCACPSCSSEVIQIETLAGGAGD